MSEFETISPLTLDPMNGDETIPVFDSTTAEVRKAVLETTLTDDDEKIPTSGGVVDYVDTRIAFLDVMVYKGVQDCSSNPNYPAASAGHTYRVSVAGKIGGASGVNVEVGDMLICNTDNTPSGNQATVGAYWNIIQGNLDGAVTSSATLTSGNIITGAGTKTIGDSGKAFEDTPTNSTSKVTTSKYIYDNITNNLLTAFDSSFVPVITSLTGTITTVSATCRYKQIGKIVTGSMKITITTNGTGAGGIVATLPVQPYNNSTYPIIGFGREYAVTGKMLQASSQDFSGTFKATIFNYDNSYPGGNGYVLNINFEYEAA